MKEKIKEIIGDSTGREAALKIAEWMCTNSKYDFYYHDDNLLEKALQHERNYVLNCSDGIKDLSPEASNRRILNDIKRMKEKGE